MSVSSPRDAGILPAHQTMPNSVTAESMVHDVILAHRATSGLARAFEITARVLGISARRARAYWHNEVNDPRTSETRRIQNGYAAWIDQETRRLDARRALLTARLDALRSTHEKLHDEVRSLARTPLDEFGDLVPGTSGEGAPERRAVRR